MEHVPQDVLGDVDLDLEDVLEDVEEASCLELLTELFQSLPSLLLGGREDFGGDSTISNI